MNVPQVHNLHRLPSNWGSNNFDLLPTGPVNTTCRCKQYSFIASSCAEIPAHVGYVWSDSLCNVVPGRVWSSFFLISRLLYQHLCYSESYSIADWISQPPQSKSHPPAHGLIPASWSSWGAEDPNLGPLNEPWKTAMPWPKRWIRVFFRFFFHLKLLDCWPLFFCGHVIMPGPPKSRSTWAWHPPKWGKWPGSKLRETDSQQPCGDWDVCWKN